VIDKSYFTTLAYGHSGLAENTDNLNVLPADGNWLKRPYKKSFSYYGGNIPRECKAVKKKIKKNYPYCFANS